MAPAATPSFQPPTIPWQRPCPLSPRLDLASLADKALPRGRGGSAERRGSAWRVAALTQGLQEGYPFRGRDGGSVNPP
jgi:hypothetical protein